MPFSDADLANARALELANMPDTCIIRRPAYTDDAEGGRVLDPAGAPVATLPCRRSGMRAAMRRASETEIAGWVAAGVDTLIVLPWDAPVVQGDDLEHHSADTGEITDLAGAIVLPPDSYPTSRRVLAKQITPDPSP